MVAALATFSPISVIDLVGGGPFSPIVTSNGSDKDKSKLKINYYSTLLKSFNPDDKINITGLNADIQAQDGLKIWLEIAFDASGGVTTAKIKNSKDGWNHYPNCIVIEGTGATAHQTFANILVCTVIDNAITDPQVGGATLKEKLVAYRHIYQDLVLMNICFSNVFCQYPMPIGAAALPKPTS